MWKKTLLCLGLALILTAAAQAAEVRGRSLVETAQGVELSFEVDDVDDTLSQAVCLSALYDGQGRMLQARMEPLGPVYTGWADKRFLFSPNSAAAYAKVFLLEGSTSLRPLGTAARVPLTQEVPIDSWAELQDVVGKAADGTVFRLRGGTIPCQGVLDLRRSTAITIRGSDEETTILDFGAWSDTVMGTPQESGGRGIRVNGSHVTLENFIVQSVPGVGIYMREESCAYNVLQNIVTRYNFHSGVYLSNGANHCTLRQCDSYRNCDIYKKGQDADGFSVSLELGAGILLDNCRAFENADDAYDNFDNHNDVTYLNCYAWNNGGVDCYTGKQDVDRGLAVDRDLPLVRLMCKERPEFEKALDEGRFELPLDMTMTVRDPFDLSQSIQVTLGQYITTVWEGNGNGFKLGSGYSATHGEGVGPEGFRRLENCISFDNYAKGFDRNNGTFRASVTNFLSFGNHSRNYWSDQLTDPVVQNALSYREGKSANSNASNFPITSLDKTRGEAMAQTVYQRAEELETLLRNDIIPGRFLIEVDW